MHLDGLLGSAVSLFFKFDHYLKRSAILDCLNNKEEAAYLDDLEQMIGEQDVLFYQVLSVALQIEDTDNAMFTSRY
jgi:transcription-repair coupling factor (superfamily II helicase)